MAEISIRPATVHELQNALNDQSALAAAVEGPVPEGWPEKEEMFRFAAEQLAKHPEEAEWRVYLFFDAAGTLVGSGGFQGPPDANRGVEIGYEIAPVFRKRGLGTVAVSALVEHARKTRAVGTVFARTVMDAANPSESTNPSVKILMKREFTFAGPVPAPDGKGMVWQWELDFKPAVAN
jgi:RimJ/RimL family protein N-acetyltransferase